MILVLKQPRNVSTESTPAMAQSAGVLPVLSPVVGKLVIAAIDLRIDVSERLTRWVR
ncbi:hypothetical protein [Azospirillum brasilense]|uniref:hypothetical protein n=1 Tax=Azospirillum brasilense TaxID=192 RepID=UPI001586C8D2|nr:hypothetical protein [Azospirillum brasilense]